MNEEIRELFDQLISDIIQEIPESKTGSKERTTAVDDLAKLYKLRIDELRAEWDYGDKHNQRVIDDERYKNEVVRECELRKRDDRFRWVQYGLEAAKIGLPLIFYAFWMTRGFKFEETGTYRSKTFMGLINRFKLM